MAIRDLINPPEDDIVQQAQQIQLDLAILNGIRKPATFVGKQRWLNLGICI